MKITNTCQNYINQTYANSSAQASNGKAQNADVSQVKQDSISLSSTTQDLQKISEASQVVPADRLEKVQALKAQVESNQYTIDASQIAEKIVGNVLDEIG